MGYVTLPTERVSWNFCNSVIFNRSIVTLPTERVSWNFHVCTVYLQSIVTLPTERVSWNMDWYRINFIFAVSRSPRSVWVEISFYIGGIIPPIVTLPTERVSWNFRRCFCLWCFCVTLPTERVSWNSYRRDKPPDILLSRSPRSVWVEIVNSFYTNFFKFVTLPTERVSWNTALLEE